MNNEKLLLTPKEIANACRKVDIELYGKDREPDTALESSVIPPEVEIQLMNKSICQAQLDKARPLIEEQERKRIGAIVKDILNVGSKQENENWVRTWFIVKGLLVKLRQTLKGDR